MLERNRGAVLIGAAVILIVLVLVGGRLMFRGAPEAKLVLTSIPNDLTLTLDGHQVPANGELKVRVGEHTLTGARKGFQSYTQTVTVEDDGLTYKMYLYANSAEGREWAEKHPEETLEAEAEAGRKYDEINQRLREKYPVLAVLPYIGPGFKATQAPSKSDPKNPEAISLEIKLFLPEGKTKAMEWINGNGWDATSLDIIWTR